MFIDFDADFVALMQGAIADSIRQDRVCFYERMAMTANQAAEAGDIRGIYTVLKRILGSKKRPPNSIEMADGTLTSSESERQATWQDHFCKVAGAFLVNNGHSLSTCSRLDVDYACLDKLPEKLFEAIRCMFTQESGSGFNWSNFVESRYVSTCCPCG